MTKFSQIAASCICLSLFLTGNGFAADAVKKQHRVKYDACKLNAPPVGSSVLDAHGLKLLTFPANIGPKYTGCQKTWFGEGELFLSLVYLHGQLSQATLLEPEKEIISCTYHRGTLKSGPEDVCERIARETKIPKR